ncbi:MAG TPA: ROK family protein, partial [Gemmatimonadaceae bacterium]|nr:ROK family protein [Gemmatimonadaceae bacterium]
LIDAGSIYSGSTIEAPRGRRPEMLYVRTRDRLVIAVDVRLSMTYLMLSDFGGRAIAMDSFETITQPNKLARKLGKRIVSMLDQHNAADRCEGIGLVVPGMVDRETGRVIRAPQLGWRDVEIRETLTAATGLHVQIENAPIAAALARIWLNADEEKAPQNFIYVTVSDGVGAAIVSHGEVVRGANDAAGEFGHVAINPDKPECMCGSRGCLEAYTSNLATIARYLGHEFSPKVAREIVAPSGVSIGDVIARWRQGDGKARHALEETARYLAVGLSGMVNAINPAMFFVGGEITESWELFAPRIRAVIESRALTIDAAHTPVIPEAPGSHPRLTGAIALVAARGFAAPVVA